jgi:RND family efflux transporter MFP subunit
MGDASSKRWLRRAVVTAVLVAALATAGWCFRSAWRAKAVSDPQAARARGEPIPVRTAPVTEMEADEVIGATALTTASQTAVLTVGFSNGFRQSSIVVDQVHVYEGDAVRKGQVLFELNDQAPQAYLRYRQAALEYAEANLAYVTKLNSWTQAVRDQGLKSAKEEVVYREKDKEVRTLEMGAFERVRSDYRGAISDFMIFEATSKLYAATWERVASEWRLRLAEQTQATIVEYIQQQLTLARSELDSARAELTFARRDVARCKVVSPLDGFMTLVQIVPGSVLQSNSVISSVLRLDPIHVRVDFPQERIDALAVGQAMEIVFDSFPKERFAGKVIRIAPAVEPQLRVLPVVVEVPNPGSRIKAGISSYARLRLPRKALSMPAAALLEQGDKTTAFRVEGGRARMREVRTGRRVGPNRVEVLDGLSPDDEVVIFHNFYRHPGALLPSEGYLQDNDRVDVDWRKWARRDDRPAPDR